MFLGMFQNVTLLLNSTEYSALIPFKYRHNLYLLQLLSSEIKNSRGGTNLRVQVVNKLFLPAIIMKGSSNQE